MSIFTLLETSPMQLHADMHQKQRLKNLEKFTGLLSKVLPMFVKY
jgi:superfamily II DNA/RNA helicase